MASNIGGTVNNNGNPAATHFGKQVRKARRERGWSIHDLARDTGLNAGHLSRIERGLTGITERSAEIFDRVFPDRRGWFVEYHRDSQSWTPPGFRRWHEYEGRALHIAAWSPSIVHGLLQVGPYARALLEVEPAVPAEVVSTRLAARMERQKRVLFRDDPPAARFVIDYPALYREVGSPEVMAQQLEHLLSVASLPHVTLQVLPQVAHCANASELIVVDDAVYVEHLAGGYVYVEPETITPLERVMTTIQAECYRASESLACMREAKERWTGERAAIQGRTEVRA